MKPKVTEVFYEPDKRNHGLPYNPFKALVVPRPIAWITTMDEEGRVNLAPFSFFNMMGSDPPCVVFGTSGRLDGRLKDTQDFAERGGDFVINIASYDHFDAIVETSFPFEPGESEIDRAGLAMLPSRLVRPPRIAGTPAQMECIYLSTIPLPSNDPKERAAMVLGKVVGVHIADEVIVDGKVDIHRLRPISRLGYTDYATVDNVFSRQSRAGRPVKL